MGTDGCFFFLFGGGHTMPGMQVLFPPGAPQPLRIFIPITKHTFCETVGLCPYNKAYSCAVVVLKHVYPKGQVLTVGFLTTVSAVVIFPTCTAHWWEPWGKEPLPVTVLSVLL